MAKIQTQRVHHVTFVGSNREATIEFYQGFLGRPLVFEQPNLDVPDGHTLVDLLGLAHRLRLEAGDYAIAGKHLAPAVVPQPTAATASA